MRRRQAVGSIVAVAMVISGGVAAVPAEGYTINVAGGGFGGYVSGIGDFRPPRDPSIAAASRVFGAPSSRKLTTEHSCDVRWKRLRLRITFANFGRPGPGETVCSDRASNAQTFSARGPRFRTWKGLRVGDDEERLLNRHSTAEYREGSWWLKVSISPYGPGEQEFAVVNATTGRGGLVKAIRGYFGAAGD